ncbi:MAG TPA: hypothetical protein VKH37_08895 [Ferruginibacter sp.]|nr:hypothetical protein [Ferruginibacter sp.]
MKKIIIPLTLIVLISWPVLAGRNKAKVDRVPFCGFSSKKGFYYSDKPLEFITKEAKVGDETGIPEVVNAIEDKLGFNVAITVYIAKEEDNCFATIANGKRLLIADHVFLSRANTEAGTKWAAISIIAHEIGHHIAGFNRHPSQLDSELDADYWSGYALQKLGASEAASIKCIMHYGTDVDSDSHPAKTRRAQTIMLGYHDAQKGTYDKNRCESCN